MGANNLAGQGPWAPESLEFIMYKGLLKDGSGKFVDLKVEALSDYEPDKTGGNGRSGGFGLINLKAGSSVTLLFSFSALDKNQRIPVTLDRFEFTFLDLDHNNLGGARETVHVWGSDGYKVVDGVELIVSESQTDDEVEVKSDSHGKLCDNPTSPEDLGVIECDGLTVDQEKRAIMFLFSNKNSFTVKMSVGDNGSARNILFAGASTLVKLCPGH